MVTMSSYDVSVESKAMCLTKYAQYAHYYLTQESLTFYLVGKCSAVHINPKPFRDCVLC